MDVDLGQEEKKDVKELRFKEERLIQPAHTSLPHRT